MNHPPRNLDIAVIRTLLAVAELGSFARAAARVGRSESAVSLQLKRLEEQTGEPLFHRVGRGMALTVAGEALVAYGRRLIELNDETFAALAGGTVEGTVRLGVPQDFAETWLPAALVRFARAHPSVKVETIVERSPALIRRLARSELDLAMLFSPSGANSAPWSAELPMRWIGPQGYAGSPASGPLPLVVFDPPCFFRSAAGTALDHAGMAWNVAFTSPNLVGLWAAVGGGLGITVRTPVGLPSQLRLLGAEAGLPDLPRISLALGVRADGEHNAAASRLTEMLIETIETTLGAAI
jgi:DNA-binding transcriptional LysR family regulator